MEFGSGGKPVLIVRARPIIENRVTGSKIAVVWVQPGVNILGFDLHDAAIVASRGHLRGAARP
ncbi:hypothetical protein [Bordetella genomosp. 1]|uniref:hypothetical protein n=1 Tax=Bordetella genomosp. 1 TaxID=1395607 RepID=UPI0011774779